MTFGAPSVLGEASLKKCCVGEGKIRNTHCCPTPSCMQSCLITFLVVLPMKGSTPAENHGARELPTTWLIVRICESLMEMEKETQRAKKKAS